MTVSRGIYHKSGKYRKNCKGCGKEMEFKYYCHWRVWKYCSTQCARKYNHPPSIISPSLETKSCRNCGKPFEHLPDRKNRKKNFCSSSCQGLWANKGLSKWACSPWSCEEDKRIQKEFVNCVQPKVLAESMNRSVFALLRRAKQLGVSRSKEAISASYALGGKKNKGRKRPDFVKNVFKIGSGVNNAFYGKTHSDEARKKMSDHAKRLGRFCKLNNDPEFQKKRMKALIQHPNKPELMLGELLQSMFPGEYKYVGDGSFIIDRLNPDFVNVNGKKKIIELFGEQYHHPDYAVRKLRPRATESGRKEVFSKFGYDSFIVWSKELYHDKENLKRKIREFHENSSL